MAQVIFGNYSSVMVPRQDRDSIRNFIVMSSVAKSEKRIPNYYELTQR